MIMNYTRDEIDRVVSANNFPPNKKSPSPAKAIGMRGIDVVRDCLELHDENARLQAICDTYQRSAELAEQENARLREQLPDGMQHCTIKFLKCKKGHGRLTATNWKPLGCHHCEIELLRAAAKAVADAWNPKDGWHEKSHQRVSYAIHNLRIVAKIQAPPIDGGKAKPKEK